MTTYLPSRFDERIYRLALGVEPIDAERVKRIGRPIGVAIDGVPMPLSERLPYEAGGLLVRDVLPRVDRHNSCLHALVYRKGLYHPKPGQPAQVKLRFLSDDRRYVPRRLAFPLEDPAVIEAGDPPDKVAGDPQLIGAGRLRGVYLFPGAAYDLTAASTGLRGRARIGATNDPVRWVRVEARLPTRNGDPGKLVGRAHGDDRGEFLLLIWPEASDVGPLRSDLTLTLKVDVFAASAPPPATPFEKQNDPLWDLPLEQVVGTSRTDPVTRGEQLPPTYTVVKSQDVVFELGRLLTSEVPPFMF